MTDTERDRHADTVAWRCLECGGRVVLRNALCAHEAPELDALHGPLLDSDYSDHSDGSISGDQPHKIS